MSCTLRVQNSLHPVVFTIRSISLSTIQKESSTQHYMMKKVTDCLNLLHSQLQTATSFKILLNHQKKARYISKGNKTIVIIRALVVMVKIQDHSKSHQQDEKNKTSMHGTLLTLREEGNAAISVQQVEPGRHCVA